MHQTPWNTPPPFPQQYGPPAAVPRTAGFGRRIAARVIDYVLLAAFAVIFFIAMSLATNLTLPGGLDEELSTSYFDAWAALFFFGWGALLFFYDWLFHIAWGRTIGKAMVGIKVVRARDGGRLTQGQAAGRSAVFGAPQSLPCIGHTFTLIDCLVALTDRERSTALHDKAAGTTVIRA